jgi:hypothetical protein
MTTYNRTPDLNLIVGLIASEEMITQPLPLNNVTLLTISLYTTFANENSICIQPHSIQTIHCDHLDCLNLLRPENFAELILLTSVYREYLRIHDLSKRIHFVVD